ncbi:MAG: alpha/beta hydrolase [Myxococcota bacterium]
MSLSLAGPRSARLVVALAALLLFAGGCRNILGYVATPFVYDEVPIAAALVKRDVPYRLGDDADAEKHRLDLFLPDAADAGEGWPIVVFVHGGGWTSGDRGYTVGGADIYGNFGRYLASHGIGAAVISYRLQFDVDWTDQVEDVARALAWVQAHAASYGGDPDAVFLMGHSAGAQLASFVAFDPGTADAHGAGRVCGVIPVSGAGYDLADEATYEQGARLSYYERRFRVADEAWQQEASVIPRIHGDAPPALVLYAEHDWDALRHQAALLEQALTDAGATARLQRVEGRNHYTVLLALTDEAGPSVVDFVHNTECGGSAS